MKKDLWRRKLHLIFLSLTLSTLKGALAGVCPICPHAVSLLRKMELADSQIFLRIANKTKSELASSVLDGVARVAGG